MSADWRIHYWPQLEFDVFLSHSREDKESLVIPVANRLRELRLSPWIDRFDYPVASDPFDALRTEVLKCRHIVYFITSDLLKQGRGWCAAERTYSDLIQCHFQANTTSLWDFELPLIFLPPTGTVLRRLAPTIWQSCLKRADWYELRPDRSDSAVDWAVSRIKLLIQQQQARRANNLQRLQSDASLSRQIREVPQLEARLMSILPNPALPFLPSA